MTAARRASVSAVVLTVLAVGVMLLMIMFAARSGPQRIVHGTLVDPSVRAVTPSFVQRSLGPLSTGRAGDGVFHSNPVFRALGVAIRAALAAVVVWLVFLGLRRLDEGVVVRPRRPPRPEQGEVDRLHHAEPLAEEVPPAGAAQPALLRFGTPRH